MCNFTSFPTLFIAISVHEMLEKLQQGINKYHPQRSRTKLANDVHWGPTTTIRSDKMPSTRDGTVKDFIVDCDKQSQ